MDKYLKEIARIHRAGKATEMSYRSALEKLLQEAMPQCRPLHEPQQELFIGRPDFLIRKKARGQGAQRIGYIETKKIGEDLDKIEKSDQFEGYRDGLDNLILTDYLEFRFFRNRKKVATISIAESKNKKIEPRLLFFDELKDQLKSFADFKGEKIVSSNELAKIMAHKARLMKYVFEEILKKSSSTGLEKQLKGFRDVLIHDMSEKQFADVYAETITYGLFIARFHDKSLDNFSRQEARDLIPESNPLLQELFYYICGPKLDKGLVWIVDELCEIYALTDLPEILKDFNKRTGREDPIIHFYETFLGEYDKKRRKAHGVYFTPDPVVKFIINAVDESLKTHFGLPDGLAHKSKIEIDLNKDDPQKKRKGLVHKVQLLDVATGTGSFLAQIIRHIYYDRFQKQQGAWSSYVDDHLLPRLHGFELRMAAYAMCHLKLDLVLRNETQYEPEGDLKRLSVYLTNSLEDVHPDAGGFSFVQALSDEANQASRIKEEMPIMVAFGNPPYKGKSDNKGKFVSDLMEAYKKEPTGQRLEETNSSPVSDDYVKFIRLAEHYIEKNKEGILAYITNSSYLDGIVFRGMRHHLLKTFDDIYILDLHGSSIRKEESPDGSADKNVFDIMVGVAIIIAVKHGKGKGDLAQVHHAHLWGDRESKYKALLGSTLQGMQWKKLTNDAPDYFFFPRDSEGEDKYKEGFSIESLFPENVMGIATARDKFTIQDTQEQVWKMVQDFVNLPVEAARSKYDLGKDAKEWKVHLAQQDLKKTGPNESFLAPIAYRAFDIQHTYYTGKTKGFFCRPRREVMHHFLNRENVGLVSCRNNRDYRHTYFLSNKIMDKSVVSSLDNCYIFPLYLYNEKENVKQIDAFANPAASRKPNLHQEIVDKIAKKLKLPFIADHKARGASKKRQEQTAFSPLDLLDYIYAVLHFPTYREKYKTFLKIDFPRIPYPKTAKKFWRLVDLGGEIRALHLMEHKALAKNNIGFPIKGDRKVEKLNFSDDGKVWINKNQYFNGVPQTAWEFYIGGYQPAQKWLKDRKGRKLSYDDIAHYQKIIIALAETHRIMGEINKIATS